MYVTVLGKKQSPYEITNLYLPLTIYFDYSYYKQFNELPETTIEQNYVFIHLSKEEEWDSLDITITEPGYKSYFELISNEKENYISFPSLIEENVRNNSKGYHFGITNPYKLNPESNLYYKIGIHFTNEELFANPSIIGKIQYKFVTYGNRKELASIDLIEASDLSKYDAYVIKDTIKQNEYNKLHLFIHKCEPSSVIEYQLISSNTLEETKQLSTTYELSTIETYTDLTLKFNVDSTKQTQFSGVQLFYNYFDSLMLDFITDTMKEEINVEYYSRKDTILYWHSSMLKNFTIYGPKKRNSCKKCK